MKEFKVNRNSWHYKIVNWERVDARPTDLCAYIRTFILKLSAISLLILAYLVISISFIMVTGDSLAALVASLVNGMWLMDFAHYVFLSILVVVSFGYVAKRRGWNFDRDETAQPGFIRMALNSKLDKFCTRIKYE